MCCEAISGENGACCSVVSACSFGTLLAITFIVLGALGMQGQIEMAPVGAQCMVGLGTGIILGMISGVIKCLCR